MMVIVFSLIINGALNLKLTVFLEFVPWWVVKCFHRLELHALNAEMRFYCNFCFYFPNNTRTQNVKYEVLIRFALCHLYCLAAHKSFHAPVAYTEATMFIQHFQ